MGTLNVNCLNTQLKTEINRMDKRYDPIIYFLYEIHFKYNSTGRLKVNKWEKLYHANINLKKEWVILIIDKADFRANKMSTEWKEHYIIIKE